MQGNKSSTQPLIILGIDPGTNVTGYGLVSYSHLGSQALDYGCIRPPARQALSKRYLVLYEALMQLIEHYKPHAMSVETQFVYKNPQSAIKLGMARGMAILAATQNNIPVYEYAPKKAKLAVVGRGTASKQQVQKMMQALFKLPTPPTPEDAADALALALCHGHTLHTSPHLQGVPL